MPSAPMFGRTKRAPNVFHPRLFSQTRRSASFGLAPRSRKTPARRRMTVLDEEVYVMQNPALGALLLWRFVKAHAEAHPQKLGVPLPLAFLVLPLVWHATSAELIEGTMTASGLRKYAA